MKKCKHCNSDIPKNKDYRNTYCSQSCSNVVLGISRRNKCYECGDLTTPTEFGNTRKRCNKCMSKNLLENKTLEETLGEGSNRYNKVRSHARALLKKHKPKICGKCGYDKHVEACHLKPIKSFPLNTLVSEINSITNLEWLCPNHHWELDHGE